MLRIAGLDISLFTLIRDCWKTEPTRRNLPQLGEYRMPSKADWPPKVCDAISAKIIRWDWGHGSETMTRRRIGSPHRLGQSTFLDQELRKQQRAKSTNLQRGSICRREGK